MAIKNLRMEIELENPSLINLIKDGLRSTNEQSRRGRLHARDTYCGRRNAILANSSGISQTDMIFELYTEIGKTVENIIIKGLKASNSLLYKDFVLPNFGVNLGGRIDAIAFVDGKIRILEIKNIGELPSKPKNSHLAQAKTYAAAIGLPYSIVYVSRKVQRYENNRPEPDICVFNYPFNHSELKEHMFDVTRSHLYKEKGFLPPKLHRFKVQCEYCDFTRFCFDGVPNPNIIYKDPTPDEELILFDEITKLTDSIMTEDMVKLRRDGALTHISTTNRSSKKLLEKINWDEASK